MAEASSSLHGVPREARAPTWDSTPFLVVIPGSQLCRLAAPQPDKGLPGALSPGRA